MGKVKEMFIEKRRRRWYAVYDIPKEAQPFFGKRKFVQSLKTESKTEAERLVLSVVAGWKAQVEQVRKADPRELEIEQLRSAVKDASPYSNEGEESERDLILESLRNNAERMDRKKKGTGVEFYQRVTGQKIGTKENLSLWTASLNGAPKTNDMKEAAIRKLASTFPTLQDITKREVQLWAQKLITEGGLSPKTVRRDLSFCRQYWRYLQNIEVADENLQPFDNLQINQNNHQAIKARRKAFTPEEVVALWDAAKERNDQQLTDLIELAMWTGARIEELCSLKVTNVTESWFKIIDAKTDQGWRTIPIHSKLKPTMKRLVECSKDGYVLGGLSTTNKYAKRSNAIGKRFGRLKNELGFDRSTQVFHSIRKTVMTLLKNAGVPEAIAADIAGHSKPTITYGLYPGDPDFEVVREAIEKLNYPNCDLASK